MFADSNLFPLPLQAFEELFVHDDNVPDYPAVFSIRFKFDGVIDSKVSEHALHDVMTRQPMLNIRLNESDNGSLEWVLGKDCFASVGRVSQGDVNRLQPIDLRTQPPFRLSVSHLKRDEGIEQSIVTFQFHHAAFDGVGALTTVSDWMKSYGRLSQDGSTKKVPQRNRLDQKMLLGRCAAGLTWRERMKLAPWSWLSLIGFVNFFKNRPIPLLPSEQIGNVAAKSEETPIISILVNGELTEKLKERASKLGVTMNDLIAVELLAAIKQWQAGSGISAKGSHLRITIPINERTVRHRRMPGCNHCTMISLDRRPDQISTDSDSEDFTSLLQQVHHEIDTVRDWRLSLSFWSTLSLFRRLGGIKRWFATEQCRSTCVLTNLGQLAQRLRLPTNELGQMTMADVPLTHFEVAAPIRYGTAAAFSVFIYRRQLNITMNYDRKSMSRADANDLLDTLQRRLSA